MDTNRIFEDVIREQIKSKFSGELEGAIDEAMESFLESQKMEQVVESTVKEVLESVLLSNSTVVLDSVVGDGIKETLTDYFKTDAAREIVIERFQAFFEEQYGEEYIADTLREDQRFYDVIDEFLIGVLTDKLKPAPDSE